MFINNVFVKTFQFKAVKLLFLFGWERFFNLWENCLLPSTVFIFDSYEEHVRKQHRYILEMLRTSNFWLMFYQ